MPSEIGPGEAYVWVWLPGATKPVVAGRLEDQGELLAFNYGRSYLERDDAVSLYGPELPLVPGRILPQRGLRVAGCINDAGPDAWGQRVIMHRLLGSVTRQTDPAELSSLTYLLESGSNRVGALDFQVDPEHYVDRSIGASLEEMQQAAERLEAGETFSPDLDAALLAGSSAGGARPKVLFDDGDRHFIAKFSSRTDTFPVVKAEAVAMELARRVGLDVASTELTDCASHDVLLVERFDRTAVRGQRRMLVSALTILELDEVTARYATYHDLAEVIRGPLFGSHAEALHELFARIVFNICVGNTDDHARNHAALWDGSTLTLTPAYDICPQTRSGGEAVQAMAYDTNGNRLSQLVGCQAAAAVYQLNQGQAREVISRQLDVINAQWSDAADVARLTKAERSAMWGSQILNSYALEGYGGA
jgi:serine/threonine-protein kinase HipA